MKIKIKPRALHKPSPPPHDGRCDYRPGGGRCYYPAKAGGFFCLNHDHPSKRVEPELPQPPQRERSKDHPWIHLPASQHLHCMKCGTMRTMDVAAGKLDLRTHAFTEVCTCRTCGTQRDWIRWVERPAGPRIFRAVLKLKSEPVKIRVLLRVKPAPVKIRIRL